MKKIIKGIGLLMCVAIIATVFTGCGKAKTLTASKLFNNGTILYYCESDNALFDKDTSVEEAYLILDGTLMMCYFNDDETLGAIDKMGEDEIKAKIEEEYNSKLDTLLNQVLNENEPLLKNYSQYDDLESALKNIARDTISETYEFEELDELHYIVDRDEYVERYNYELVRDKFSNLFTAGNDENQQWGFDDYNEERKYDGQRDIYTITFKVPIEDVRNQMNAFYEKYPSVKEGIEAVRNGEDAEKVAGNIFEAVSAPVKETDEYKNAKAEAEKILKDNNGYKYKIALVTDGTGNSANQEGIIYQTFDLVYENGKVSAKYDYDSIGITDEDYWKDINANGMAFGVNYKGDYYDATDGNCIQVYDSYYGGWSYTRNGEGKAICARFKKNYHIALDKINEKKFVIDPSKDDLEKLFD